MTNKCKDDKYFNEKTGRCISKDGATYKKLMKETGVVKKMSPRMPTVGIALNRNALPTVTARSKSPAKPIKSPKKVAAKPRKSPKKAKATVNRQPTVGTPMNMNMF
jgi:hypothetical protein